MTKNNNNKGFTLIEILVALALSGIVLTAIYTAYQSQHKTYIAQEAVAEMQQNLRAGMYLLTQEIRMAGYDPRGTTDAGIVAGDFDDDEIRFKKDSDSDGTIDDASGEDVAYSLYSSGGIQKLGRKYPASNNMPVAINIDALDFVYLDEDNNTTATASEIRSVQITIVARTGRSDPDYTNPFEYHNLLGEKIYPDYAGPANDGFHRRALSTQVKCRNLGL